MRFQTYLWDLDGTLTRSAPGIMSTIRYALNELRVPQPDEETLSTFIGPPLYVSFREKLGLDDEMAKRAVALYKKRYEIAGWKENEVFPGIPRLLRTLRKEGAHIAVVSQKNIAATRQVCEGFGLMPYLEDIVAPTDANNASTDKAGLIRHAMEDLGAQAESTVMIGDRCYDVEGAVRCGIASVGVTFGYGSAEELSAAGATHLAGSAGELYEWLLGETESARGIFISMEGMDGCGKTTQRKALVARLRQLGWEVSETREPGGDAIAEKIRRIILDPENSEMYDETEAYLYAASRAQNVRALILPALKDGRALVCDRFVDSSIAYQGGGRNLGVQSIGQLNALATAGLEPDLTIYLAMPSDVAIERRRSASTPDRLERERQSFFDRTAEAYEALYVGLPRVIRVDASGSVSEVTERMLSELDARLFTLPIV